MEEIDDKFPLFEMLKIHEFAWFPKIKTLTASYFLSNNNFFFFFGKKTQNFHENRMILSKTQSQEVFYFLCKKQKRRFRNWICHKIQKIRGKFSRKSSQFVSFRVGNQCERFFTFFIFRKVVDNEMVFWKILPTNTRKSVLNWSKSSRFKHFEHV